MSTLKELLNGVEVEWKSAKELFNIKNGNTPSKKISEYWTNGIIPWFRMEDIRKNGRVLSNSIQHVSQSAIKGKLIPKNSLIMSTTATLGEHALVLIPFITNQQITSFSLKDNVLDSLSIKYLFYHFFDFGIWCQENANKNGGLGIIGLDKLKKYTFPIPYPNDPEKSLAIQQEIVRVLDQFTETTNELTTQLANERFARKKQYEFYREQLFSFVGKKVDILPLGDESIGRFVRGSGLQKKNFTDSGVGCIHYGEIYTYYKTFAFETKSYVSIDFAKKCRKANTGDLVIATTSENDEDVCKAVVWLGNEEIAISSDACFYKHNLSPKYVAYYFLTEQFQKQKRKFITGTKVRRVNVKDLEKILIPIPSLEKQKHIVYLLDEFDRLHKAIEEELTNEIALRNQQYEYYREQLLSFPSLRTAGEAI